MNPWSALESPPSTISARPSPVMSTKIGAERKLRPWNLAGKPGSTVPVAAFHARSLLRIGCPEPAVRRAPMIDAAPDPACA